jgi:diaminopimelate epimerase
MMVNFTKMHGAGNDFVVLNATDSVFNLTADQIMYLGNRHLGVGADQILVVERSHTAGVDFRYRIFNGADGQEVEQCGNGARCFVRYVLDQGLSEKTTLHVQTMSRLLVLHAQSDGQVTVNMSEPQFQLPELPFDGADLQPRAVHDMLLWPLEIKGEIVELAVLSMGNPHAVHQVVDVACAQVDTVGLAIAVHPRFARGVNVGFMQVLSRSHIALRVFERGAGETLSCGTGACAAVVAGIAQGSLNSNVDVDTQGGRLRIEWPGHGHPVLMTGPAVTVYQGEIDL